MVYAPYKKDLTNGNILKFITIHGAIYGLQDKKRILVVDDEQDIALTCRLIIEESGNEIHEFTDPLLALKSLKPKFYDLILQIICQYCF